MLSSDTRTVWAPTVWHVPSAARVVMRTDTGWTSDAGDATVQTYATKAEALAMADAAVRLSRGLMVDADALECAR